ncbi:MAG: hypothetical protein LBK00_00800 [Treponema sp.]|nr:hypothetical protein [Treponema sp.]
MAASWGAWRRYAPHNPRGVAALDLSALEADRVVNGERGPLVIQSFTCLSGQVVLEAVIQRFAVTRVLRRITFVMSRDSVVVSRNSVVVSRDSVVVSHNSTVVSRDSVVVSRNSVVVSRICVVV